MYMCLDTQRLYYDETDNKRVTYGYTGVNTRNDLMYYITPTYGMTYYCWEDNSLWLWNNKWVALYSDGSYPDAYVYDDNRNIIDVYREPNTPVDTNGLLKDGSVVIRDRNRIIKGKIFIEESNDNMTISSFLGGGIRFLPNGKMTGDGELFIGDVPRIDSETGETITDIETGEILYDTKATIRAAFSILNNEGYIDYSETPQADPSEYPNSEHKYEIFHSGNLDVSAIKVITPQDIYSKLQDPSLPSPLDLNVKKIDGHPISEISLVGHTHTASNISDFNTAARQQALVQINDVFSRMTGEGISVSYNSQSQTFKMTANPFTITLTGGVSGSGLISKLSDTNIQVDVDPSKHIHQNYVNTMTDLQDQINAIVSVDPQNYYNKTQIDNMISSVEATDVATAGKPLKINNNLILPATSQSTNSLANPISIELQGDVTGTVSTDLSSNVIITTNANNILSQLPEQGKALAVNANGDLPGNAQTSSALDHNLRLVFSGEVSGNADIDTSLNQNIINLTLNPGNNIVQTSDLGVTVATLGNDGKLTPSQLPASQTGLVPKGNWNPQTGAPSNNPVEGQFWVADTEGIFDNKLFQVDDWCLYYDSDWRKIDTNDNVLSVNGYTGIVNLQSSDIGAIDTSYINYVLGSTIPQNKIVLTTENGRIAGASVDNLTNPFSLMTDNTGDVKINASSTNTSTDGTSNLDIKLEITDDGYNNIMNEIGLEIDNNGVALQHKPKLNFKDGFTLYTTNNSIEVNVTPSTFNIIQLDPSISGDDKLNFELLLTEAYANRANRPILLIVTDSNDKYSIFKLDGNAPNIISGNNVTFKSYVLEDNDIVIENNTNEFSIATKIKQLVIEFGNIDPETIGIIDFTLSDINNISPKYLATDASVDSNTPYYTPTYDCQPATKKYVDDCMESQKYKTILTADGISSTFNVVHNLGTEDIIIQMWDNITKKLINIEDAEIIDQNTIEISFTNPITNDINLVIMK